jgi:hypothetical protein
MPFGHYVADGEVLQLHRENNTSVIVLLAEEVECLQNWCGPWSRRSISPSPAG